METTLGVNCDLEQIPVFSLDATGTLGEWFHLLELQINLMRARLVTTDSLGGYANKMIQNI